MKINLLLAFSLLSVSLFSQKEHNFVSTGQQKLFINPSFAGSSKGLNIQTLASYNYTFSTYAGADYSIKSFAMALTNNSNHSGSGVYRSNQTDLSLAYKVKLNSKLTLIPSLQASYFERKVDAAKIDYETLMRIDRIYETSMPIPYIEYYPVSAVKKNVSFSSGLLLDINKKMTFGIAVYDISQPDRGLLETQKMSLSQIYHISGILFTEKKVQLQPYSVLKLQRNATRYYEVGTYTSYKAISLHTGFRNQISYNYKDITTIRSRRGDFLVGFSITYKKIKFGYTITPFDRYNRNNELFFSANLFNKDKSAQRNLMIN
ncbi:MAG: type IX secretion system membrane protein PorP/SprF [Bacteroidia bacterium]|nr:type IX secretion system membrane protein PorP/SprF [Bacteroidia bacterium]